MTKIVEALLAAREDQAKAGAFYNAFLSSEVFMPVQEPGPGEGDVVKDEAGNTSLRPIAVQANGKTFILLFDTAERLNSWAAGKRVRYVGVPGHSLFEAGAPKGVHVVLNPGTDVAKEFVPEELEWIAAQVQRVKAEQAQGGTQVQILPPEALPAGLEDVVRAAAANVPEVVRLYCTHVVLSTAPTTKELVIVMILDVTTQERVPEIVQAIGSAAGGVLPKETSLLLHPSNGTDDLSRAVANVMQPIYERVTL